MSSARGVSAITTPPPTTTVPNPRCATDSVPCPTASPARRRGVRQPCPLPAAPADLPARHHRRVELRPHPPDPRPLRGKLLAVLLDLVSLQPRRRADDHRLADDDRRRRVIRHPPAA